MFHFPDHVPHYLVTINIVFTQARVTPVTTYLCVCLGFHTYVVARWSTTPGNTDSGVSPVLVILVNSLGRLKDKSFYRGRDVIPRPQAQSASKTAGHGDRAEPQPLEESLPELLPPV